MIYPENIGENLSIDEVSLSKGELYTFVTNKQGRGKKKTLVASIKGTKSQDIIESLCEIEQQKIADERNNENQLNGEVEKLLCKYKYFSK